MFVERLNGCGPATFLRTADSWLRQSNDRVLEEREKARRARERFHNDSKVVRRSLPCCTLTPLPTRPFHNDSKLACSSLEGPVPSVPSSLLVTPPDLPVPPTAISIGG